MTKAEVFGHMCWLATQSPAYRTWTMDDVRRLFGPPIALDQFLMFEDGSAFVTWAWLSQEASIGFANRTRKLQPGDWQSGDDLWMIDMIAPGGRMRSLVRAIRQRFPKGTRAHGTRAYGRPETERIGVWVNA